MHLHLLPFFFLVVGFADETGWFGSNSGPGAFYRWLWQHLKDGRPGGIDQSDRRPVGLGGCSLDAAKAARTVVAGGTQEPGTGSSQHSRRPSKVARWRTRSKLVCGEALVALVASGNGRALAGGVPSFLACKSKEPSCFPETKGSGRGVGWNREAGEQG